MPQFTIEQAFDLALQHHRAGRLPEAENLYRQILTHHPKHADAIRLLGVIAYQTRQYDIAVDLIRRAIALRPDYAEAFSNLGNALRDQGQLDDAIAAFRQAIALSPNFPEAHSNLGNALRDKGQLDDAITAFRQSISLDPNLPEAHSNLGNALKDNGQLDQAIAAYRQALALRPAYAQAHNNLGNALIATGQLDEAIAAFRAAIALRPDFSDAHRNLGHALKDNSQLDQAITSYREAIALQPADADVHSSLIYAMHMNPAANAQSIAQELRRWNHEHAEPLQKFIHPHANNRDPARRLRIGYVSPDFLNHVVGHNLLPLFRQHDHQQFEISCYAHVPRPDPMTSLFQQNADRWRDIALLSDEQVANQIRQDQIDILVDLALHTAHNRLLVFARKPAPVQVTFAGYPSSTGLTAIDYRIGDPWLDPVGMDESIYSEQTIRLPDSFWCYDPLDCRDIPVNPLPTLSSGVITFGCLNNPCKVNDDVLSLWSKVLQQIQNSRLLLLSPTPSYQTRTIKFFADKQIDPARIEFIPRQLRRDYLKVFHRIDLGLDTFPYNGHTTTLDSLWMAVPVITLIGSTPVARAGWCQLSNLGLGDLAAQTPDQFVQIAAALATDLPRLEQLRSTLRQKMEQSPLMDAPQFAKNIEAAYHQMWRKWCETSPTES
jgi:predicted O-linked N-acetylglucosamine transferase (SPINDLY family)